MTKLARGNILDRKNIRAGEGGSFFEQENCSRFWGCALASAPDRGTGLAKCNPHTKCYLLARPVPLQEPC
jgi:hypothetical protein